MGLFNFWKKKKVSKVLPEQKAKPISKIGVPPIRNYKVQCAIIYKGTPLSTVELKIKAKTAAEAEMLVNKHVEFKPLKTHQIKR